MTIYNIYPQSFQDSNGDGIGDLPGILKRLDYLDSLGVDTIWLNPIYPSPMKDAGYDITDFCSVAARYGTLEDLDRLVGALHDRGMRLILDLVAGHTSSEHPWFVESCKPGRNAYSDYYIWTDCVFPGAGDLTSSAGFIAGHGERDGRYLSNFFHFQPALNYGYFEPDPACPWQLPMDHPACREVRGELMSIMRFWLDRGVDGFRVDMASSLVKNDPDQRGVIQLWQEILPPLRAEYPHLLMVSEWSNPIQAISAGFDVDFLIHSGLEIYTGLFRAERGRNVFSGDGFSYFSREGRGSLQSFLDVYLAHREATRHSGRISIPTGNHDLPRISEGRCPEELRVAYAFVFTMPGVPSLYYGDELGMRNIRGLSKEGGYNRTPARTPMQWDKTHNAFSTAPPSRWYLPSDWGNEQPTVEAQEADPDSLLGWTRKLIKLRKENPALWMDGDFDRTDIQDEYPLAFRRSHGDESYGIFLQPANHSGTLTINWQIAETLVSRHLAVENGRITYDPFAVGIFKLAPPPSHG